MGYAFGLVPFTSAGIGAPHIRERAYWVANSNLQYESTTRDSPGAAKSCRRGEVIRLADTNHYRQQPGKGGGCRCKCAEQGFNIGRSCQNGRLGNANVTRLEGHTGNDGAAGRERQAGPTAAPGIHLRPLEVNGFWRDADWLFCRDGKWRPVEPGTFPLVDGAAARMGRIEPGVARVASSNRVGRLKGYGNAINAQAAAAFIRAYMGVT
jgi:DNA (cytosine-5)-methyltransferase 1